MTSPEASNTHRRFIYSSGIFPVSTLTLSDPNIATSSVGMMAVLAAILPVVSRSSSLALELYRVAAESKEAAKQLIKVASAVSSFALILKQVGTIIKEDDRLPSPEVCLALSG